VKETLRWAEGLDGLMSLGSIDPNVATTRKVVVASSLKQDMDVASPRAARRKRSTSRRPKTDAKQGHSGASQLQLLQLAAAFRLCPAPSRRQILGISKRLNLPADRLEEWFHSRRALQEWVVAQPSIHASDVASMFYSAPATHMGAVTA